MVIVTNLTLTDSAARRVALIADKQAKPAVLRLAVDGGGCAGFTYRFALGEPEEGDAVAETAGVRLVVDPVSLDLLDGSEIDYVEDLGGAAFKVRNPNAASGCGCGSSFGI
jgi:iron-sulfur cluster assembly accessory protein